MAKIRLKNDSGKVLAVWLEPLGEDYWMNPEEGFIVSTETAQNEGPDEVPFDVVFHEQGVSVWVNVGLEAVVRDQSGAEVDCGHQRPLEVLRKWTKAAEAAALRASGSVALREMTLGTAEAMRRALTQAEAAVEQARERPSSP
ncbi:hypothetical protein [Streptomyces sp. NPDC058955]|uniref:hypothetical protein n=1 Tax=unclassified Streptomyces TaxID=2593676 RepID=UPI0036524D1E